MGWIYLVLAGIAEVFYAAAMPRLPFLGTGLGPLGQWVVVPMIVIWYLHRLSPDPTD